MTFVDKYVNNRIIYNSLNNSDKHINKISKSRNYSQLPKVKIPYKYNLFDSLKPLFHR